MDIRQVIEPNLEAVLFGSRAQLFGNYMEDNVGFAEVEGVFCGLKMEHGFDGFLTDLTDFF
jgi:hypothetical protein